MLILIFLYTLPGGLHWLVTLRILALLITAKKKVTAKKSLQEAEYMNKLNI